MNQLVSVIVPCYKVQPYLRRCVDSILRQTHRDLEVILVDDGSPDRCGEICDEYAAADGRVRVLHQSNQGLSAARNAALEVMTGRYVTFVDSDDWLADDCVETLHRILVDTEADLSVCNMRRTSNESEVKSAAGTVLELDRGEAIAQIIKPKFGSMVAACGKLYPAAYFSRLRFPVGRLHEDEFTTYRIILQTRKVVVTTKELYLYWQRPDSIMGSPFNPKAALDVIDALSERAQVWRTEGMMNHASTTSGQVLGTYMHLAAYRDSNPAHTLAGTLDLRALAKRLRRERQPLKFRAFYTLALTAPRLALQTYALLANRRDS